ncbi:MAG TPA: chemotaxis protein CheB [Candidatus Acidoferrales bacterium]|jgi:two-component system chemotaxis response regulator CheB|nr:chemotaxis protein CheB [Candidatus Acidoferrales bacterium]
MAPTPSLSKNAESPPIPDVYLEPPQYRVIPVLAALRNSLTLRAMNSSAPSSGIRKVIAVGASAGGVEALKDLFQRLPPDLPAAIFTVLHIPPWADSHLPEIINKVSPLLASHPRNGEHVRAGRIYVARPNCHLILDDSTVQLTNAPKENRNRPAVDPLFRSAALNYGPDAIGVVLTGALDDGTAGLWELKRRGGIAVVQDPREALHPQMPNSAIANVDVDYIVPLNEMAELLTELCRSESGNGR